MSRLKRLTLFFGLLTLLVVAAVAAQTDTSPETCTALVETALTQLDQQCEGLSRNSACYGNTLVQASFIEEIDPDSIQFSAPSDRVGLTQLSSLRASALNEQEAQWGIAVMSVQANLPGTLPGQGVVMLVLGDTEVANEVPPDEAFQPIEPLTLTVNAESARIRAGAGLNFNVLTTASSGSSVDVDARNAAGDWVRVVSGNVGGWIFRDLVNITQAQVDTLPVVDDTVQSSMQSFYFRSGIGNAECESAPNAILLQSPRNTQVDLRVNETEITLSSTAILETRDQEMIIYMLDGEAQVNNLIVPRGYKAFVDLEDQNAPVQILQQNGLNPLSSTLPVAVSPWRTCNTIDEEDRARFSPVEDIPAGLLNYAVSVPTDTTGLCASPEQLQALARQAVIATQNAQQQPPTPAPNATDAPVIEGECSGFRLASPREGMGFGPQPFYWDPPAGGAANYRIFVYGASGEIVAQATTPGTQITLDTGEGNPGGGVRYSWTVEALGADGSVICSLPPISMLRSVAPTATPIPDEEEEDDVPFTPGCDIDALYSEAFKTCKAQEGACPVVDETMCTFSCSFDPPYPDC